MATRSHPRPERPDVDLSIDVDDMTPAELLAAAFTAPTSSTTRSILAAQRAIDPGGVRSPT